MTVTSLTLMTTMNERISIAFDVDVAVRNNFNNLKLIQALRKAIDSEIKHFGFVNTSATFSDTVILRYKQEEL